MVKVNKHKLELYPTEETVAKLLDSQFSDYPWVFGGVSSAASYVEGAIAGRSGNVIRAFQTPDRKGPSIVINAKAIAKFTYESQAVPERIGTLVDEYKSKGKEFNDLADEIKEVSEDKFSDTSEKEKRLRELDSELDDIKTKLNNYFDY